MPSNDEPKGCLFAIFKLFGIGSTPQPEALPYRRKKYLLSKAEREFFVALQRATNGTFLIFAMVRLADLLYLPKGTESRQTHFNRISAKHIDFVLCDVDAVRPVLAIELDDSSHERADRRERDAFVDQALSDAGLPLLRIRVTRNFDPQALSAQIEQAIAEKPPQR